MVGEAQRIIGIDRVVILHGDGMSNEEMVKIAKQWEVDWTPVRVYNVIYENGHPMKAQNSFFTGERKDDFVEFMAEVSLTHRVRFVEKDGAIFITESKNGQTNIDADLIEAFARALRH